MTELIINNLKEIITNPGIAIFGALTLIEIVPIKVNPWKWLFSKLSDLLLGDIKKDIQEIKTEVESTKVQNWRWNVLDFANSCKNGRKHTLDEWKHAIDQLADYENYVERHGLTNGVFEEDAKYLRNVYQEKCRTNDFL